MIASSDCSKSIKCAMGTQQARPVTQKPQGLLPHLLNTTRRHQPLDAGLTQHLSGLEPHRLDRGQPKGKLAVQVDVNSIGILFLRDERRNRTRHVIRQTKRAVTLQPQLAYKGNCPQIGMVLYDLLRPDRSLTGMRD